MRIMANQRIRTLFIRMGICVGIFASFSLACMAFAPKRAALYIFSGSLCMAAALLAACARYFTQEDKILERAGAQIADYVAGNRKARLACQEEGQLYRVFHQVNSLAAILNAQAENERRLREFLKDAIGDISHQLKTPLAALNVYNGILQEEEDLPAIREFVRLSEGELDRIETLVQNLLKITKLDAGVIALHKRPENVREMLEGVRAHFAYRAGQEGKEIFLEGDADVFLACDRAWMQEALDNLVKNALDHTKQGDAVWIKWKRFLTAVQIVIKDNGCGIHPEDLYHIFKRFYRSRFLKDAQGIGLGLPLAKAIVEMHGGSIEADSQWGEGAVFVLHFLLPREEA